MEKDQLEKLNNIVTMLVNELTDLKGKVDIAMKDNPRVCLDDFYRNNPSVQALIEEAANMIMDLRITIKQVEITRINMLSNLRDIDRLLSETE